MGFDPASSTSALGTFIVVISAIAWGAGVVNSQRAPLPADATMRTATTLLTGAAMLLGVSGLAGEFSEARTPSAWRSAHSRTSLSSDRFWAFTAYFWLLERYSATLAATHTFVNPAVAVILAWAIGDEAMSAALVAGLVVIAASIALVRRAEPTAQSDHSSAEPQRGDASQSPTRPQHQKGLKHAAVP